MAQVNKYLGISTRVSSNQDRPHPHLRACVLGHFEHPWREPLHQPSVRAFAQLEQLLHPGEQHGLILDSGCGTGVSTQALADIHPERIVIGIDRSAARLQRFLSGSLATRQGNCIWVRARLETIWRLALGAGWGVLKNYLLYPNPRPKSDQFKKRWHAHPVFPVILALSGSIELRTNWRIYAEEFASAVQWSGGARPEVELLSAVSSITPFERKYAASGHDLYRVCTGRRT